MKDQPEVKLVDSLEMSRRLFCKINPSGKSALACYLNGKRISVRV